MLLNYLKSPAVKFYYINYNAIVFMELKFYCINYNAIVFMELKFYCINYNSIVFMELKFYCKLQCYSFHGVEILLYKLQCYSFKFYVIKYDAIVFIELLVIVFYFYNTCLCTQFLQYLFKQVTCYCNVLLFLKVYRSVQHHVILF